MRVSGRTMILVAAALSWSTTAARGDGWDPLDNGNTTKNQLVHGSEQSHNLVAQAGPSADEDWYQFLIDSYSSYEVVVDGTSPTIFPVSLQLVDSAGAVVTGSGSFLTTRSLVFQNTGQSFDTSKFVRVRSGGCTTGCGADSPYTIRAYDTTYAIPRFNNSATQVTVLVIRNNVNCGGVCSNGTLTFFNASGALLKQLPFSMGFFGTFVLNTSTVPELQGQSGSVSVTGGWSYGALSGKAVAVEPATGFTFDTAMIPRPR